MTAVQPWDLEVAGAHHRVTVLDGAFRRTLTWTVDGTMVTEQKSSEEKVVLSDPEHGSVLMRFTMLGRTRRVTWYSPDEGELAAQTGLGGIDFVPEPGTPAAKREEQMRANPRLWAARHVLGGIGKVVVPIVLTWLLARFAFSLPLPDINLPRIPFPDINVPDLPLPDIDLPDLTLPEWVKTVLNNAKYVVPILIGIALARAEIVRRRKQDELREKRSGPPAGEA